MAKALSLIDIKKFRGINQSHNRDMGQFSDGKNFVCHDGRFKTRPALIDYPGNFPFAAPVLSLHYASTPGITPRLIAESGGKLYHKLGEDGAWTILLNNLAGTPGVHSTPWGNEDGEAYLLFANGNVYAYSISSDGIGPFDNMEEGVDDVDLTFENLMTFKGRVFAWHPNSTGAHLLFMCGYNSNDEIDYAYWPPDFAVDPTFGSATETILNVIPRKESMFVLTDRRYALVYGSNEEDLDVSFGGYIGVYDVNVSDSIGDIVAWLAPDKRIYAYSGTTAYPISAPIDEYLEDEIFTYVWAKAFNNQFWIHFPHLDDGFTNIYIFDITDEEWYRWVVPSVLRCGGFFKDTPTTPETLLFGTHDHKIVQYSEVVDKDFTTDRIETDGTLGPFDVSSRDVKLRSLHLTYHDKGKAKFIIYNSVDDKRLSRASTIRFKGTEDVVTKRGRLRRKKGKNLYIKLFSTDRVDELHKATIAMVPGKVK